MVSYTTNSWVAASRSYTNSSSFIQLLSIIGRMLENVVRCANTNSMPRSNALRSGLSETIVPTLVKSILGFGRRDSTRQKKVIRQYLKSSTSIQSDINEEERIIIRFNHGQNFFYLPSKTALLGFKYFTVPSSSAKC